MIDRKRDIDTVERLIGRFPVVGIIGARQVGKTTLARTFASRFPGPPVIRGGPYDRPELFRHIDLSADGQAVAALA